jgi:flavin-dependent dehydrogenase
MPADTQVVIVGGGPAGLAVALELHRQGYQALVVDRGQPPIDKACGEGLMPDGVQALGRLGVKLEQGQFAPLKGIRYIEGNVSAEAQFPRSPGAGIRRTVLHQAMVDRASEVGLQTRWGVTVRGLDKEGVDTDQGRLRASWVVGADGLHSRVRRWVGLTGRKARFRRYGVRRHYALEPWTDLVEVYWADRCEAYVTPISRQEVGVAFLWGDQKGDFDTLLTRFPRLERRLKGASSTGGDRGAALLEQRTQAVHRDRVALVGDAAGYRDAITGEGLSMAFHQARALAAAIGQGELASYGRAARELSSVPFLLIRILLEVERRPRLRRRLIGALAKEPRLFARLLAIHTRDAPPRSIGPGGILQLARGLLSSTPSTISG